MADKKKKGRGIKIVTGIFAVILVLCASAAGIYQFYIKPKYSEKLVAAADKILASEEVKQLMESEEVKKILESEGIQQLSENNEVKNMLDSDAAKQLMESQGISKENTAAQQTNPPLTVLTVNNIGTSAEKNNAEKKTEAKPASTTGKPANSDKVKKIAGRPIGIQNTVSGTPSAAESVVAEPNSESAADIGKGEISPKDMADGMRIMSKIDMSKISGLTSGNATPEQKSESVKYIKDTLTDEEIAKALELMVKYKDTLK